MAEGPPLEFTRVDYSTILPATDVAVANFNGDAYPDLAVTQTGGGEGASVLLGGPGGTFGAPNSLRLTYCYWATSIATADMNNDGYEDVVVGRSAFGTFTSVCANFGKGDGTFYYPTWTFGSGTDPQAVVAGDLTGDGEVDIATANRVSDSVSIIEGNGDSTFHPPVDHPVGDHPTALAQADLNGDGRQDLVAANADSDDLSLLLADNAGGFAAAVPVPVGNYPSGLAVGDVNGDNKPDIAVADAVEGSVSVLINDGSGSFGARSTYLTGSQPLSVAMGDLTGDGVNDLAVNSVDNDRVSVLVNQGTGTFGQPTHYPVGDEPYSVKIADLNTDGRKDLVVANRGSDTVSVLLARAPATANVSPGSIDFGAKNVGTTTRRVLTVSNPNAFPVRVDSATLSGINASDYTVDAGACLAEALDPSEQCQVNVDFGPTGTGTRVSSLAVTLVRGASPIRVSLSGTGVAPNAGGGTGLQTTPRLATPSAKGPTKVRRNRLVRFTVTIPNIGDAPATAVTLRAKGRGVASNVSVGTIAAGRSQMLKVKIRPRKAGTVKVTFTVASADAGTATVARTLKVRR